MREFVSFPRSRTTHIASILLLVFVVTSVFGMWQMVGPHMDGSMNGCPLMVSMTTLCNMSALEHLSLWQRLFIAIRPNIVLLGLLLTACALCAVWMRGLFLRESQGLRLYKQKRLLLASLDPLREALSRGILHPKIYG